MNLHIAHIEAALPELIVTNDDLAREYPQWDMPTVEQKAGVLRRHIARPDETAFDLSKRACARLLETDASLRTRIGGIVSCTQSPDYIMPSNAHLLHAEFGFSDSVFAFDYNLACSGYIYGLAISSSMIQAGLTSSVLLITADTYSKYISPGDRSARVLFGDGAAASLVEPSKTTARFIDFQLSSHGKEFNKFWIPAGGMRTPCSPSTKEESTDRNGNVRTPENIAMDGLGVWSFINSTVPSQVRSVLERNDLTLDDVDLFVFHQASKMTIDSLVRSLGLRQERVFTNLANIGNLVSASIPVALREAEEYGVLRRGAGQKVVLCGFGVGLSYGTAVVEY